MLAFILWDMTLMDKEFILIIIRVMGMISFMAGNMYYFMTYFDD